MAQMHTTGDKFQILWSIVVLYRIYVVNILGAKQQSSKFRFHYDTMFGDVSILDPVRMIKRTNVHVSVVFVSALAVMLSGSAHQAAHAPLGAILPTFIFRSRCAAMHNLEHFAAFLASAISSSFACVKEAGARAILVILQTHRDSLAMLA
jgi:hypothetical protein